jgi:hypothetical protein
MNPWKIATYSLIVALVFSISHDFHCGKFKQPLYDTISSVSHKTYDSLPVRIYSDSETLSSKIDTFYSISVQIDSFQLPVDTQTIVYKWLSETVVYKDSIRDSSIDISIIDTLFRNRITGRMLTYKLLRPTVTNTITIQKKSTPKNRYYFGINSVVGPESSIGPQLTIITKNGLMLSAGNQLLFTQPNVSFGVAFPLNKP